MSQRKYLIAGNWKMNKASEEAVELAKGISSEVGSQSEVEVAVCPPFTALACVGEAISGSNIQLGGQNMYPKANGAFTGEVSAPMLKSLSCSCVILGHSERREYFKESDAFINEKVLAALENNLRPILCVGETIEEREADKTIEVVSTQLSGGLKGVSLENPEDLVIAYEPVWAIGTGKTATPEMAQEVHAKIRELLAEQFDEATANRIQILYGGSMKPGNAADLLDQEDIDGGLIGGASLEVGSFVQLVEIAGKKLAV